MTACVLLLAVAGTGGCRAGGGGADSALLSERATRLADAMANPDSLDPEKPVAVWKLPATLKELSGLALTADGRLLTHGDEKGRVFEIDYRRGVVVKSFTVGTPMVHGDFEAITVVRDTILLLTSDGKIFRFLEGADKSTVPFTMTDTRLGSRCEFEGMAFDSTANTLLLACKVVRDASLKGNVVIFRLPLGAATAADTAASAILRIPLTDIAQAGEWGNFHPSEITIDPVSGNYLLVSGMEEGLLEVTPQGVIVRARALSKVHEQSEGIVITKDHLLIISDEAKKGPARITLYPRLQ